MPLSTQIIRNGYAMSVRWGNFHVAAMALAASFDTNEGPFSEPAKIYDVDPRLFECYPDAPFPISPTVAFQLTNYSVLAMTPLNKGTYTLNRKHQFSDMADGEIFLLLPGDLLIAYR